MKTLVKAAVLCALAAAAIPVLAQSAGANIVNLGWFHFTPQDSSDGLTKQNGPGAGYFPNSHSTVKDADTLGIAVTHFFTDNFGLTADLGVPPTFKLDGAGDLGPLGQLGSARQWSPAIVAKWYFGTAESKLRPFVGLGATYVRYSDVTLTQAFQSRASLNGGTASASLSHSFAPVFNTGATYNFDKHWSVGLSISYIPLKTDADIEAHPAGALAALGPQRYQTSIKINPIVSFVSVGYTF